MKKKGFTLVEIILYLGLLVIIISVLTQAFIGVLDLMLENQSVSSTQTDGRYILARINYDISRSEEVLTPAESGEISPRLDLIINQATYSYFLLNNDLRLEGALGDFVLNSSETFLSSFSFRRLSSASAKAIINVDFNLVSRIQNPSGQDSKSYQIIVGQR